ncbi:Tn7-like element transposition protein TnsE [Acinetobacter sp. YH12126]|uniref:Tn7-like element transposition protein TnsE n=1 Tax=Acinetobacter sp. YH12126 TaxID=2601111 RepID=UPI0015D4558D|nr:Tn7-like element transposition protein TnsE [Acinetobacter sp. YH12126]
MLKDFPENTIIRSIGPIYKEQRNKAWKIKLHLQELASKKQYTLGYRFSNMHLFARQKCLNPTPNCKLLEPLILTYKIEHLRRWHNSCNVYNRQNQVSQVMTDVEQRYENTWVHLPKIELARALFFHNAYLARNALHPEFLDLEFAVQEISKAHYIIHELVPKSFPAALYESVEMRSVLAWILINREIKACYKSIHAHFMAQKYTDQSTELWNFDFSCPSLKNTEITVKAYYSKKSNQIYINEILEIKHIPSKLPDLIEFSSTRFIQKQNEVTSDKVKGGYGIEKMPDEPKIDDVQEANSDKGMVIIKSEPVLLSFQQPICTAKRYIKRKGANQPYGEEQGILDDPEVVATDEPSILGTVRQGEFMGLAEDAEYAEYFSKGFDAFKQVMIGLNDAEIIKLTSEEPYYHRLPKVGKSRLNYLIHRDQPRSLLEFRFNYKKRPFSIFEIDLDDQAKNISTLLMQWNLQTEYDEKIIKELTTLIIKHSLRWPKKEKLSKWGMVKMINHPKKSNSSVEYTLDEIKIWRQNIARHLSCFE